MRCLYCRKHIGWVRHFTDREYCCDLHRKMMSAVSARALRNNDLSPELESLLPAFAIPSNRLGKSNQQKTSSAAPVLAYALIIGLLMVAFFGSSFEQQVVRSSQEVRNVAGSKLDQLVIRKHTENFRDGLNAWDLRPVAASSHDWTVTPQGARPAALRLWRDSMPMSDYRLDFRAVVEQKAVSWVYRAYDERNYYATKIVITKPAGIPRAELVRFAMVNGRETARSQTGVPVQLRNESMYSITTQVKGDQFTTYLNGQMADTWSDKQLTRGGVGFYADKGEAANILWVSVTEQSSPLVKLLGYLTFAAPGLGSR